MNRFFDWTKRYENLKRKAKPKAISFYLFESFVCLWVWNKNVETLLGTVWVCLSAQFEWRKRSWIFLLYNFFFLKMLQWRIKQKMEHCIVINRDITAQMVHFPFFSLIPCMFVLLILKWSEDYKFGHSTGNTVKGKNDQNISSEINRDSYSVLYSFYSKTWDWDNDRFDGISNIVKRFIARISWQHESYGLSL